MEAHESLEVHNIYQMQEAQKNQRFTRPLSQDIHVVTGRRKYFSGDDLRVVQAITDTDLRNCHTNGAGFVETQLPLCCPCSYK